MPFSQFQFVELYLSYESNKNPRMRWHPGVLLFNYSTLPLAELMTETSRTPAMLRR